MDATTAYLTVFKEGLEIGKYNEPVRDDLVLAFNLGKSIGSQVNVDLNLEKLKITLKNAMMLEVPSSKIDPNILSFFEIGYKTGQELANNREGKVENSKKFKLYVWRNVQGLNNGIISVMSSDKERALKIIKENFSPETYQEVSQIEPVCTDWLYLSQVQTGSNRASLYLG